jgi:hypothetical protein
MSNILAWIHLFGMNIGGPGTTIFMIFAGVAGSGLLSLFIEGQLGNQDVTIMSLDRKINSIIEQKNDE